MFCSKCGNVLAAGMSFCQNCGAPVSAAALPAADIPGAAFAAPLVPAGVSPHWLPTRPTIAIAFLALAIYFTGELFDAISEKLEEASKRNGRAEIHS